MIYDLVDPAVLDQPAFEYTPDEQLDRSERAERVAVKALERSSKRFGRSVQTDEIPRLFSDDVADAEAGKIRDAAADLDGISVVERNGSTVVAADPTEADDALLVSAGLMDSPADESDESDADAADGAESDAKPTDDPQGAEPSDRADPVRTDGGRPGS